MPRKAKANGDEGEVHKPLNFSREKVEKYVKQFERIDERVDDIMATAAKECQPFKDDQKQIVKAAAEAGIPKAEFRAILRKRKLLRRAESVPNALNETQQDNFDKLQAALGMLSGTPLGDAARRRNEANEEQRATT